MFILRRFDNGIERNFMLGNSYDLIKKKSSLEYFEKIKKKEGFNDEIKGVLYSQSEGIHLIPKNESVFIMTDTGKTFSHICLK